MGTGARRTHMACGGNQFFNWRFFRKKTAFTKSTSWKTTPMPTFRNKTCVNLKKTYKNSGDLQIARSFGLPWRKLKSSLKYKNKKGSSASSSLRGKNQNPNVKRKSFTKPKKTSQFSRKKMVEKLILDIKQLKKRRFKRKPKNMLLPTLLLSQFPKTRGKFKEEKKKSIISALLRMIQRSMTIFAKANNKLSKIRHLDWKINNQKTRKTVKKGMAQNQKATMSKIKMMGNAKSRQKLGKKIRRTVQMKNQIYKMNKMKTMSNQSS